CIAQTPKQPLAWIVSPRTVTAGGYRPPGLTTRLRTNPTAAPRANTAATIAANTRYGDGPAYGSPRARRSIARFPAPATSPIVRIAGPTKYRNGQDEPSRPI